MKKTSHRWGLDRLDEVHQQYLCDPLSHTGKAAYINGLEYELRRALAQPAQAAQADLYAALEECVNQLECIDKGDYDYYGDDTAKLVARSHAVLAKTRGEK